MAGNRTRKSRFYIDGFVFYVHQFTHANNPAFTAVYMSTPNLPLRYSTQSNGAGGGTLAHICSSVMSEGGVDETGVLRAASTGIAGYVITLAANTDHAIIGLKFKAAYNDTTVLPESISAISGTNDNFRWSLQLNPVVAGVFTYTDIADSSLQRAIGASTNTITTPGLILSSGYSKAAGQVDSSLSTALRMGSTIAGVSDTLVLCIAPFGANASIACSLNFRELL